MFSYFYEGLTIDNCTFEKNISFEAGGHNKPGNLYLLKNNDFFGFVDFNDCWFKGKVSMLNNTFRKGTNIASKEQYITLYSDLLLYNNTGEMAVNDENTE